MTVVIDVDVAAAAVQTSQRLRRLKRRLNQQVLHIFQFLVDCFNGCHSFENVGIRLIYFVDVGSIGSIAAGVKFLPRKSRIVVGFTHVSKSFVEFSG